MTATTTPAAEAARLVRGGRVIVLSGAGLSTESGIPDYRGPAGSAQRHHTPMTYQTFTQDACARRRYWARSHLGWPAFASARPNAGHAAVAELEALGLVAGTITQNVDGLHTAAGSRAVVKLHGRLDRVACLRCGERTNREDLHRRLTLANPGWQAAATAVNPDGDVDLPDEHIDRFCTVDCERCGGLLKPDVVYFGERVPPERVVASAALVDTAAALLVLGSSLTVYSGRRFVVQAAKAGVPVVIVNAGPTRADELATVRIDAPLGRTLTALVTRVREAD